MSVMVDGRICKQKRLSLQIVECLVIMHALYGGWSCSTVSSIIIYQAYVLMQQSMVSSGSQG